MKFDHLEPQTSEDKRVEQASDLCSWKHLQPDGGLGTHVNTAFLSPSAVFPSLYDHLTQIQGLI